MLKKFIMATAAVVSLGACTTDGISPGMAGGALVGGGVGAAVGCRHGGVIGCAAGTVIGALGGGFIGDSLTQPQQQQPQVVYQGAPPPQPVVVVQQPQPQVVYVAPVGQPLVFNPAIVVIREGWDRGNFFREYERDVVIGGRVERVFGVAHRQRDGGWKTVHEERRHH